MNFLLTALSTTGTFFLLFGVLYFIQKITIGFLPIFRKTVFQRFILGDLLFSLTSILFIVTFVEIGSIY